MGNENLNPGASSIALGSQLAKMIRRVIIFDRMGNPSPAALSDSLIPQSAPAIGPGDGGEASVPHSHMSPGLENN